MEPATFSLEKLYTHVHVHVHSNTVGHLKSKKGEKNDNRFFDSDMRKLHVATIKNEDKTKLIPFNYINYLFLLYIHVCTCMYMYV